MLNWERTTTHNSGEIKMKSRPAMVRWSSINLLIFPYLCGVIFVVIVVDVPVVGNRLIASYHGYKWPRLCLRSRSISGEKANACRYILTEGSSQESDGPATGIVLPSSGSLGCTKQTCRIGDAQRRLYQALLNHVATVY